jgi:hypothetical protein
MSPSVSASPSITLTRTPVPLGVYDIEAVVPVPNPNPDRLLVRIPGRFRLGFKLYTVGYTLALAGDEGPLGPGWVELGRNARWADLPNGVYYAKVLALNSLNREAAHKTVKVIIAR